ncbi:MAG: DNA repair protein RadA [Clostridia bacterium]|nr:DNA repair protein RadA [Clostridia bacterium]
MAKNSTVFICSECGCEQSKWLGKCPSCNSWNTFYEEKITKTTNKNNFNENIISKPINLQDIKIEDVPRFNTGFEELNRVLGGGLVQGSLTLVGGDPGVGKSTLVLQLCNKIDVTGKILYVSGEESGTQIKLRADRLHVVKDNIIFLGETNMELIEDTIKDIKPQLVIIDSIQTMYSDDITSVSGSVSQVRECTSQIMQICKKQNISTILIGHVTKEGAIAGPRVLEHMVDTVLYLEGERYLIYRILRSVKNRFGATNEIGIFEMQDNGLSEINNPSTFLLSDRSENLCGTVIVPALEGTRTILVELQSLVTRTVFGMPRRTTLGIDFNKLNLLMAVIEKHLDISLGNFDAYTNVVGGIKIYEPAIDLAIAMTVLSSLKNIPISNDTVVIGEIGLNGEIKSVNLIENRVKESEKMGFKKCIIPKSNKDSIKGKYVIEIIGVSDLKEAIDEVIG